MNFSKTGTLLAVCCLSVFACKSREVKPANRLSSEQATYPETIRIGMSLSFFVGETLADDWEAKKKELAAPPSFFQNFSNAVGSLGNLDKAKKQLLQPEAALSGEFSRLLNTKVEVKVFMMLQELATGLADGSLDLVLAEGLDLPYLMRSSEQMRLLGFVSHEESPQEISHIIVHADSPIQQLAELKGRKVALPQLRYQSIHFVEQSIRAVGGSPDGFFALSGSPYTNREDPTDDVIDKVIDGVVLDNASLQAYQRRKPQRANKLRILMSSDPSPNAAFLFRAEGSMEAFKDALASSFSSFPYLGIQKILQSQGILPPDEETVALIQEVKRPPNNPIVLRPIRFYGSDAVVLKP